MSRALAIVAAAWVVLVVGGWTTGRGEVAPPPGCSQQDTQRRVVLMTGGYSTGGDGYARFCGPGVVTTTATASGESMTIRGGWCGRISGARWLYVGLFSNGALSRELGRGVSLVLEPGGRVGPVKVVDGILQPAGVDVGLTGSARVASDLRSGSFSVVTVGLARERNKRYMGHWTCSGEPRSGRP